MPPRRALGGTRASPGGASRRIERVSPQCSTAKRPSVLRTVWSRAPSHTTRRSEHFSSHLTGDLAFWHHAAPQLPGPGAARARKEATHDAPPERQDDEALNRTTWIDV